jgi:hypothetical protein
VERAKTVTSLLRGADTSERSLTWLPEVTADFRRPNFPKRLLRSFFFSGETETTETELSLCRGFDDEEKREQAEPVTCCSLSSQRILIPVGEVGMEVAVRLDSKVPQEAETEVLCQWVVHQPLLGRGEDVQRCET